MFDRLLNGALWLTIMALITGAAISALLLCYHGLFDLCAGRYPAGASTLSAGTLLGCASYLLARNANDLMDR